MVIQTSKTQKPGTRPGFFGETKTAESRYPARDGRQSGRRAREVIPAAMRAEVRIIALVESSHMDCSLAWMARAAQEKIVGHLVRRFCDQAEASSKH